MGTFPRKHRGCISLRNAHCCPQMLWLGGRAYFLGAVLVDGSWYCLEIKRKHFYLQRQITLLVFWDGQEKKCLIH